MAGKVTLPAEESWIVMDKPPFYAFSNNACHIEVLFLAIETLTLH